MSYNIVEIDGVSTIDGNLKISSEQRGAWNISSITGEVSLPAGAATESKQDSAIATLSSIDGKVATEAKQDTNISYVSSISGKVATEAKQDAGISLFSSIDGKVATEAKQDDLISSSSSIDGKLSPLGQASMITSMPVAIASNQSAIPTNIRGKDPSSAYVDVAVDETGQLKVVTPPPSAPAETDPVSDGDIYTPGKNGGTATLTYTITNGQTLYLQKFNGGTEATAGKFELYYDPNGNGTGMTLIRVAYLNIGNFDYDLSDNYEGDGTAGVRLIATNNTNTNGLEFAMFFTGYEQDT